MLKMYLSTKQNSFPDTFVRENSDFLLKYIYFLLKKDENCDIFIMQHFGDVKTVRRSGVAFRKK